MKISLAFLVFILVTVTQFCTSNVLSKRDTQEALLSSDENGIQNGSDIIMINPGPLNVVLTEEDKLDFEVCSTNCFADFLVCYEADSSGQNVLEQCDTKCGFFVTTRGDKIEFMRAFSEHVTGVKKLDQCFHANMKNGRTSVLVNEKVLARPKTCSPKIENGNIKLTIVNASSECPVSIKNAILKPETTTAAPTTLEQLGVTSPKHGNSSESKTTDDESGSFIGNYWWIFLILGILIVGAIIGIGIYCYIRRSRSKKAKKTVAPPRKIQHSKSPVVLQPSTEPAQNRSEATPASVFQQSSILSHKSLMWSKKEDGNKSAEETDLTSMKPTARSFFVYRILCVRDINKALCLLSYNFSLPNIIIQIAFLLQKKVI